MGVDYKQMCKSAIAIVLFLAGLAWTPTLAASSQESTEPTIRTTATEVLLEISVRDKRGRPVSNIKASDIEIYEDGVKQEVKSLRYVGGREKQRQKADAVGAVGRGQTSRPLRAVNLVCVVFHNLDPLSRNRATLALQEFLQQEWQPDTWMGLFYLDDRLTPLYPFTNNKAELEAAARNPFALAPVDFGRASEPVLTANPTIFTVQTVVDMLTRTATTTAQVTGGELARTVNAGADVHTGPGATAHRGSQVTERRDFSNIIGMRETDRILTLIGELGTLPGRKTVLLATTGLATTGDPERFESILSKANEADVTIYSMDVSGLDQNSTVQAGNIQLGQVASVSRTQGQRSSGEVGSLAQAKEKSRQGDTMNDAVRNSDPQASLRALAEGTGGFLIANTNDFRKPFQRITESLEAHYEAVYRPVSRTWDGRLRNIEVKVNRPEWRVESRGGYFAIPDLPGSRELLPYETAALAVLNTQDRPRGFDLRTAAYEFGRSSAGLRRALVFEVPGSALEATQRAGVPTSRVHVSLVALVKDSTGQIVDTYSSDSPFDIPTESLNEVRATPLVYQHPVTLGPGKYSVDTVVLDREGKKIATDRFEFENPAKKPGVGLSSVLLLQRVEPLGNSPVEPSDPLIYRGNRMVPMVGNEVPPGAQPLVYLVVYPDASQSEKPKIQVEVLVNGSVVASQVAQLADPDPDGSIPTVIRAVMRPGDCEMRITAMQGQSSVSKSVAYKVSGAAPAGGE
jgi:VWFA-related protein